MRPENIGGGGMEGKAGREVSAATAPAATQGAAPAQPPAGGIVVRVCLERVCPDATLVIKPVERLEAVRRIVEEWGKVRNVVILFDNEGDVHDADFKKWLEAQGIGSTRKDVRLAWRRILRVLPLYAIARGCNTIIRVTLRCSGGIKYHYYCAAAASINPFLLVEGAAKVSWEKVLTYG
jgi:hypothetical protein